MAKKKEQKTEKTDEVRAWLKRIEEAEKERKREADEKGWQRFLDEYEGKYTEKIRLETPVPPINMVFGHVHTMIPKLYFRDPFIVVNPKRFEYIQRAKVLQVVLNYLIPELGLKKEIEKLLMDVILIGHGWLKYGYSAVFGKFETAEDKKKTDDDTPAFEINEYVQNEEIFVIHVPWDELIFDNKLSKDPPYDCRWIAHMVIKPLDAVLESDLFENMEGLKSNVSITEKENKKDQNYSDSDMKLVKYYEVTDRDSGMMCVVAPGHDKYLKYVKNPYEMKGFQYSMLKFSKIPGKPYPLSDIGIIEPQILERIKLRASQLNHVKRWNRQMAFEKGAMEKDEISKITNAVDGALIQYNKGYKPPHPIDYAPMQSEIFALDRLIQQDLDAVIGVSDSERGGAAKTNTRTLGELEVQLSATQSRTAKRQDALEDFLEEVCTKVIELLKQFQDMPKYVRITGMTPEEVARDLGGNNPDGTPKSDGMGISFTKEDIQGDYDVEVKAGSTIPLNKQNRLRVLETMLQLAGPLGITPGSPVSLAIGKEIFRDLDIKEAEKAYEEWEKQLKSQQQKPPQGGGTPQGLPAPGAGLINPTMQKLGA